jgi:hypothetical protein
MDLSNNPIIDLDTVVQEPYEDGRLNKRQAGLRQDLATNGKTANLASTGKSARGVPLKHLEPRSDEILEDLPSTMMMTSPDASGIRPLASQDMINMEAMSEMDELRRIAGETGQSMFDGVENNQMFSFAPGTTTDGGVPEEEEVGLSHSV